MQNEPQTERGESQAEEEQLSAPAGGPQEIPAVATADQTGEKPFEAAKNDLQQKLDAARAKADDHWNQLLRTRAEIDNLRKRQERELENAHKFALDSFVREMLQVWDSLELGHDAAQDASADVAKLREGTELTLKVMGNIMGKFGVEQVDPQGEPFNPEYHQAITTQPRADVPPNTVVSVVQRGYLLNGRLVRPAMVIVSRGGASP